MKNDPKRESGRTIGLILQCIGKAVENPGTEIEFINHNPQNLAQHLRCRKMIEETAKKLNLDITVVLRGKTNSDDFEVIVKSNWVSPYAKKSEVEEAYKNVYGGYPDTSMDDYGCYYNVSWNHFNHGYNAALEDMTND